MARYEDKNTKIVLAALTLLVIVALFLSGCRSKRTVEHTTYHKLENVDIKRDTMYIQTAKTDSTLHTWNIISVTTYREDGTKEREEVEERHTEQKAVVEKSTKDESSEEMRANRNIKEVASTDIEVDAAPVVKTTSNYKWIVWGILCILVVAVVIIYLQRKKFLS